MIKIVLGIIIVILVGYIGYCIEKYYKARLGIIREYESFIFFAERETEFLKTNVEELISKFEFTYNELKKVISSTINGESIKDCLHLNDKLKSEIATFISEITKCDYRSIKSVISNAKAICNDMIIVAEKDKIQKGELARKLAILAGIGLIIIII